MNMTLSEIGDSELEFQAKLQRYRETGDIGYYQGMWGFVQRCCSNIAKSMVKGVVCPDFAGKVVDATMLVMDKIKKGSNPKKLSSFCYWPVKGVIFNRKLQVEERNASYEDMYENFGEAPFKRMFI